MKTRSPRLGPTFAVPPCFCLFPLTKPGVPSVFHMFVLRILLPPLCFRPPPPCSIQIPGEIAPAAFHMPEKQTQVGPRRVT